MLAVLSHLQAVIILYNVHPVLNAEMAYVLVPTDLLTKMDFVVNNK